MTVHTPHDLDSLEGFERLYRAYYGYAWAVLVRLGVPSSLVDDAHQDVFVAAYRRRDTFERGRPVKPWLVGIARRVAFRYRRSQRRLDRKRLALSHVGGRERVATASFHARIEAGQFLKAFIEALAPEQREVFILGEIEGRSGPEIAERLGINLNTAYTRLRAARGRLRRALEAVEDRRASGARIDRALVLLLPRLESPGWLARPWVLAAKVKLGIAAGVAGLGIVAAVAIGSAPRAEAANGAVAPAEVPHGARRRDAIAIAPHVVEGGLEGASVRTTAAEEPAIAVPPEPGRRSDASATAERRPAAVVGSRGGPSEGSGAVSSSADASTELEREVEQLTAAREALAGSRPAEALAILEAHARAHPSSELAEARATLRIACLCALGRREQARGEAKVLLRSHPGSTVALHAASRCDQPVMAPRSVPRAGR